MKKSTILLLFCFVLSCKHKPQIATKSGDTTLISECCNTDLNDSVPYHEFHFEKFPSVPKEEILGFMTSNGGIATDPATFKFLPDDIDSIHLFLNSISIFPVKRDSLTVLRQIDSVIWGIKKLECGGTIFNAGSDKYLISTWSNGHHEYEMNGEPVDQWVITARIGWMCYEDNDNDTVSYSEYHFSLLPTSKDTATKSPWKTEIDLPIHEDSLDALQTIHSVLTGEIRLNYGHTYIEAGTDKYHIMTWTDGHHDYEMNGKPISFLDILYHTLSWRYETIDQCDSTPYTEIHFSMWPTAKDTIKTTEK